LEIKLTNVSLQIKKKIILNDINLTISEREKVAILGPNGAGKTTLINSILKMQPISKGIINNDFSKLDKWKVGYHMQDSMLNRLMTVQETIKLFLFYDKNEEYRKRLSNLLGINHLFNQRISSLSGGEKQRLLIFLTFQNEPNIIFIDEVTTGVDAKTRMTIVDFINEYIRNNNATSVFVTHYLEEADKLANRFIFMNEGNIIESGSREELFHKYKTNKIIRLENVDNGIEILTLLRPNHLTVNIISNNMFDIEIENIDQMSSIINTLAEVNFRGSYFIIEPNLERLYKKIYEEEKNE
jgi:ABC-2 type transport system ATP-binding protein